MLNTPSLEQPQSHFYQSHRLRLHYVVWGEGNGPPLLLIHGMKDHARSWDFVAQALKDRYTIYAPDLRGHGDSQWAVGGLYGLSECALDMAVLADMIAGPLIIMGHSRGGGIALLYAGTFPERVAKVIAIEGLGPLLPWTQGPLESQQAQASMRRWIGAMRHMEQRRPRRYKSLEEATRRLMDEHPKLRPELARHSAYHGTRRNEDGTYSWKFDSYMRPYTSNPREAQEIAANIQAPVLLVNGSQSWASQPEWRAREQMIPFHRSVTIEGAGHWVYQDQLPRFLEVVTEFLQE